MKTKSLKEIHMLARTMRFSEFEQHLKAEFTGQPSTVVIDCDLVLVKWDDIVIKDPSGNGNDLHPPFINK